MNGNKQNLNAGNIIKAQVTTLFISKLQKIYLSQNCVIYIKKH